MSNIDDCISCIQSNFISIKIGSCLYKEQNINSKAAGQNEKCNSFQWYPKLWFPFSCNCRSKIVFEQCDVV